MDKGITRRTLLRVSAGAVGAAAAFGRAPYVHAQAEDESLAVPEGSYGVAGTNAGRGVTFFLSPHQDDEVLSMGAMILQALAQGDEVHVALCTNGDASAVRTAIGMVANCPICKSYRRPYALTRRQFVASRDAEFIASCTALGVDAAHVHKYGEGDGNERAEDTELSVYQAREIVSYYARLFPNARFVTFSPITRAGEHRDHKALARAAMEAYEAGKIARLTCVVEPYTMDHFTSKGISLHKLSVRSLGTAAVSALEAAADEYCRFDPAQGRYAVGEHSKSREFNDRSWIDAVYSYEPTRASVSAFAGASRYQTMQLAVLGTWKRADAAVIVSGENFPDALAASSLAGCLDAPVVLTGSGALSSEARACLVKLGVSRAVLVGGTTAISSAVGSQVKALGIAVERIGGATRSATAQGVARRVHELTGGSDTCIVTSGETFADALAISPYAYQTRTPILLASSAGLDDGTRDLIARLGITRMIAVGGKRSVPDEVFAQAGIASSRRRRVAGATRFDTCREIIALAEADGALSRKALCVASGANFPDGLVAGPVAARLGGLLVLATQNPDGSDGECYPASNPAVSALAGSAADTLRFFGGESTYATGTRETMGYVLAGR